jgi:hypothetical protein
MGHDADTRAYVERRTTEGLSKKEIIRCLKRCVAREIYKILTSPKANHKELLAALDGHRSIQQPLISRPPARTRSTHRTHRSRSNNCSLASGY